MLKINDKPSIAPLDTGSLQGVKQRLKSRCVPVTTSDNSLEVAQPQHAEEQKLSVKVYVLNIEGKPLMPTTPRKARVLLKQNKAKVVKRLPFTIQLNYQHKIERKQNIAVGIDSGAKFIGFSAVTEKEELISGEVKLDVMMKKRLQDRAMYRRQKRNKLWYRKPRFENRSKPEKWLPPSIERRYQTHLNIINKIKALLPVSSVTIEVGNFDIQAIKNPKISGKDYQQGDRYGYENTKAYIIAREKCNCQLCGKTVMGKRINLHHIESRKTHGDKASNLALLHDKCHTKLHKKGLEKTLKKNKQYREATFMNIIKWRFKKDIDCKLTFGFKTFCKRTELGLTKTHYTDAFVIAKGTEQVRIKSFEVVQKRKNNRSLQKNRKGFAPSIRTQRYDLQPMDLVKINRAVHTVKGIQNYGKYVKLDGMKPVAVKKLDSWVCKQNTLKFI